MSKRSVCLLFIVAILCAFAGGANAWVRARMFDGNTPLGPDQPFLGRPAWEIEDASGVEEFMPGEKNGPSADRRWSWRMIIPDNPNDRGKGKVRIDGIINTKDTAVLWSGCVSVPPDPENNGYASPLANKSPMIYIRLGIGSVQLAYNNDDTGPNQRGWYVRKGSLLSGPHDPILPSDGKNGVLVDHGVWHFVKVVAYATGEKAGTWEAFINSSGQPDMWGNLDSNDKGNYIQWGAVEGTNGGVNIYTEYCYWGQDREFEDLIGGVNSTVTGNSAKITWTTSPAIVPITNVVKYGKSYDNLDQTANAVWNAAGGYWEANISGLDYSTLYHFYCESVAGGQVHDTPLYTFKTQMVPQTTVVNPSFESGVDIYPWEDAIPPTSVDHWQRWGGAFSQRNLEYEPPARTGALWGGTRASGDINRDWACIRQQVAVTPGKAYIARVWFWDNFTPEVGAQPTDAMGRIGIDPFGGISPGTLEGFEFRPNPDVYWSDWVYRPSTSAGWQQAQVLCVAESPVITIFLQQHFVTRPNMRLAFDDVELVEGPLPPATCADAKSWIPGLQVSLKDVVVTGRWEASDFSIVGYVEDPDRKAGIRLSCSNASDYIWDSSLGVGANVDVAGVLQINANNELEIAVKSITASDTDYNVYPLGVTNKGAGGSAVGQQVGVEAGTGASNIGLLVRTWGKVVGVGDYDDDYNFSIFIDDGSGLSAYDDVTASVQPGLEVKIPWDTSLSPGDFTVGSTHVLVTGVSSTKLVNGVQKRVILVRDTNDVDF